MKCGAHYTADNAIEFCVWAPRADSLAVVISGTHYPMQKKEQGYFTCSVEHDAPSVDYLFCIDNDRLRPDPASRSQPHGVHGPSRVFRDNSFNWEDADWKGIPQDQYIIYELHVGTFTPDGTFEAVINKLPHLQALGITAIELMPVIEFPGSRNWGYDGTYPYCPHHAYGGSQGLKSLINACHKARLAVILDVVYNHLGPEGSYFGDFGFYFTDSYKTPWGQAINYDGPYSDEVRRYFIDNAHYWVSQFHVDALRLDATHTIFDMSPRHFFEELGASLHASSPKALLIAESDLNDVQVIDSSAKGGYALDAVWSDDFHHAIHTYLTQNRSGYFEDFGTLADIAKAISDGFVYDGKWSTYRKKTFGTSSKQFSCEQFVITLQNHDQIGNASKGVRLHSLIPLEAYKIASLLLFFTPNIPHLFMGQEWGATTPFFYFTSFEDEVLAQNVFKGYLKENHPDATNPEQYNPQNPERFFASKLNWQELELPAHQKLLEFYQDLIHLKKALPPCKDHPQVFFHEEDKWLVVHVSKAILLVNFAAKDQEIPVPLPQGTWTLKYATTETTLESLVLTKPATRLVRVKKQTALLLASTTADSVCQAREELSLP